MKFLEILKANLFWAKSFWRHLVGGLKAKLYLELRTRLLGEVGKLDLAEPLVKAEIRKLGRGAAARLIDFLKKQATRAVCGDCPDPRTLKERMLDSIKVTAVGYFLSQLDGYTEAVEHMIDKEGEKASTWLVQKAKEKLSELLNRWLPPA